jgi:hypothetical protein
MSDDRFKIRQKVEFHARAIFAEVQNGTLSIGVSDFSRTQIVAARPRTFVEFEAGISRDEAIAALQAIQHKIEADGLPDTCWSMERKQAKLFRKITKELARIERNYDRLDSRAQQRLREIQALLKQRAELPDVSDQK